MTRILIVDDIQQNRYLLEMILKGRGYEVIATKNGAEALEAATKDKPDLIISDILMPVMDGFELCRRLKQHPDLWRVPFIFYTGTYTDPRDERLALSLGAERFIIKPQKPEVLVQAVDEVLEESRNKVPNPAGQTGDQVGILKEYNEALFRKLEKKIADLEADIAKREKTERALRESEERLRSVFESGTMGIAIVGKDGSFVQINDEFARMLGYTSAELLGTRFERLLHEKDRPQDVKGMQDLRSGAASIYATEDRLVRKDGSPVWSNTRISTIRDQNGGFGYHIVFWTDITDRKAMEERERKAMAQVEENLQQLATLNDQIRNPLTIIVAELHLMKKSVATEKMLDAVKAIDDLVTKLDDSWEESAKVREFLIRHGQIAGRE